MDYCALTLITKKSVYLLPLIEESLRQLQGAKIISRFNLRAAYHLIRMRAGDEVLTEFRTHYELYEYRVMPCGLTNAPATCQQFVNNTLRNFLDRFVVVSLDDILVYSSSLEEHIDHVRQVLEALLGAGLYVKAEKCDFHTTTTTFLGLVITPQGLQLDQGKKAAVRKWEVPRAPRALQPFLGFANFYRKFINEYSRVAAPLFALLKKNVLFSFTDAALQAFNLLKEASTSNPSFDTSIPG